MNARLIDIASGEIVESMVSVVKSGSSTAIIPHDSDYAHSWHEPRNEREFQLSPQRALWQTAKELKWEQYVGIPVFKWVVAKGRVRIQKERVDHE